MGQLGHHLARERLIGSEPSHALLTSYDTVAISLPIKMGKLGILS